MNSFVHACVYTYERAARSNLCAHPLRKGTGIPYSKRNPARIPASSLKSSFWLWPIAQRFLANRDARLFKKKSKFAGGRILGHLRGPLVIHAKPPTQQFFPLISPTARRLLSQFVIYRSYFFEFARVSSQAPGAKNTR
jgi:hypothetical protein